MTITKKELEKHGWKSFDTPDGLVWFGGKSHNELINHIPEDEIEDVNLEDIDFLVIGWQVQKDHWDIAGQWLDEDRQDNPEKYK